MKNKQQTDKTNGQLPNRVPSTAKRKLKLRRKPSHHQAVIRRHNIYFSTYERTTIESASSMRAKNSMKIFFSYYPLTTKRKKRANKDAWTLISTSIPAKKLIYSSRHSVTDQKGFNKATIQVHINSKVKLEPLKRTHCNTAFCRNTE